MAATMTPHPEHGPTAVGAGTPCDGPPMSGPRVMLPDGRCSSEVPLERLEADMLGLAGQLAAGMCAFLTMVGEYDERRGWASWEALSCAHWLNWRCGVGIVAAREQVRVARRLRELPVVHAHFGRGALSYSKVRAITRVAHAGNEAQLVDLARFATAAQVERCCAALRRCEDNAAAERALRDGEELAQLRRSLSWHHDDSGDLIVRARIPGGAAADSFTTAIRAATATASTMAPAVVDGSVGPPSSDNTDTDIETGLDADEALDALECRRVDALLDLVCAGAQVDSSLAPQPEIVVHVTLPSDGTAPTAPTDPADQTDPAAAAGPPGPPGLPGDVRWPIRSEADHQLSTLALHELCCDSGMRWVADIVGSRPGPHLGDAVDDLLPRSATSFDLGRHRRFPDRRLRRAVQRRDRGTCRFPGCSRRHRLHIHHIIFWEHGGRTDLDNLLALCPSHHRAIHVRDWTLTGTAQHPVFRRSGQHVPSHAPPVQGRLADLVDEHRRYGLDIAADGAGSNWAGDRIDWDCFFAGFLPHEPARADASAESPGDPTVGVSGSG